MSLKPTKEQHSIGDYFNRIQISAGSLNEDGSELAYISCVTGSPQVWTGRVPFAGLLEYPRPVTDHRRQRPLVSDPHVEWIDRVRLAIPMDTEGDEESFIKITNLRGGPDEVLPHEKGRRDFLSFISRNGEWIYYTSNKETPNRQALFRYNLKSKKDEFCFSDEEFSAAWALDLKLGDSFLFLKLFSNTQNSLHTFNPKTKQTQVLFREPDCRIFPVKILSREKVLITSDWNRDFVSVGVLDIRTRSIRYLFRETWDQEAFLCPKKRVLAIIENKAGFSSLRLLRWPSLKQISMPDFKQGVILDFSFSKDARFALVTYVSPVAPADFYRVNLRQGVVQRLTNNYTSPVPQPTLVHPKLVSFSSQGKKIYSLFYLPKGAKKNQALPVIVWPHGGPQFQERPTQRPVFQYFLSRGFAIWAPNPTGSTGFGKEMANAINRRWGTADFPDMENGIQWLKKSGWVDPDQMVIMGGSYGGFMTLRTITRLPDVFKVAVDIFGPSNLISFTQSVPEDWRPYMDAFVGNSDRDGDMLRAQSPYFELDQIRCPLLIIQGARDPRVVKAESEQVVEFLRTHNRSVEYLVFEDEGHGFVRRENELACYEKIADFIETQLSIERKLSNRP